MAFNMFEAAVPHLFSSLGPALMLSMGYIDLGKWVAAVEGGARFGFDLIALVFFFNCAAILCQYLAICIGMATGKNLAEICSEEYSKSTCILLGVQAEISMIISELTMVLGVAHGLGLLFGLEMFPCIFLATVCTAPLLLFVALWDNFKVEALYISIAGIAFGFYVIGVLISQPEFPLAMNRVFPSLSGESAYSLMALLGANIMVHNFYIHSSVVQKQRRQPNVAMGTLFHDHFFAILSIFTGIFLVNYVLMNSAAAVFSNIDVVLNFQDVNLLMDQIFRSPIAPVAFFLVLFFSSQITALNWNIGGKVISTYFFGINLSVWVHLVLVKGLAVIPALYYARNGGADEIYQLLIFCQIILAMLLPSSVIPLFRVSSSSLMGAFKIPWYVEILALSVFLGMLAANTFFIMDILFGNSSWISNLHEGMGSSTLVPHAILFLIACTSVGLTLYLTVTPLKSASEQPDTQSFAWNIQQNNLELSGVREFDDPDKIKYDVDHESTTLESDALENPIESHTNESTLDTKVNTAEMVVDSDHDFWQSVHNTGLTAVCNSPVHLVEKSKSLVDAETEEILGIVSVCSFTDSGALQKIEPKEPIVKDVEVSMDVYSDNNNSNNNKEEFTSQPEDSSRGILPTPNFESTGLSNTPTERVSDGGNGSGSLSKLSGLGRAARRQFSAILDEFWGHLFDFHGKLTQEASTRKFDVLLGLDLKIVGSSVKADIAGDEFSKGYLLDLDRRSILQTNLKDYSFPRHKMNTSLESPFGAQMGSRPYSHNMQVMGAHTKNSFTNQFESNQRHTMYSPYVSDSQDHQPATIHGYQIASYLGGGGAGRIPYSSNDSVGLPTTSFATSFIANHCDPVMYSRAQSALSSLGTSGFQDHPTTPRISGLQVERPYYKPSFVETGENVGSSSYEKKYHSSPDISALIASIRHSSLNDGNAQNAQWGGPTGTQPSIRRMAYEQSQYLNSVPRTGVPLAFNELSPPKPHRDVFSSHSSVNPDAKSLWSRQPFEQLFGMINNDQTIRDAKLDNRASVAPRENSHTEPETKILQYLRSCFKKLLKLEGSDWLFRQNGGVDEELIDRVAAAEKFLHEAESSVINQANMLDQHMLDRKNGAIHRSEEGELAHLLWIINCGDGCIWRPTLVVSFGVWCIRRILELSVVESRPELWGKYTYVLNRLQGILEPAFSKPRNPFVGCSCLKIQDTRNCNTPMQNWFMSASGEASKGSITTAPMILEMIKDVEASVSGRKGRTGTAAGDVAFPKGKENLVSVLKRYKRRLSNKPPAGNQ
ncbi:hypothetical protein J5N97_027466 [Dioscorea zingiberensis]|uniref:Ethylene-insensitive protein 2 n=1 Tax=Dioscorea zingiberensis TaxID=325984 RepID=A0A9D5C4W7_9LILI|nr:hypothetical protein J5N97_027466 [Dioscorea zingiberensis]